MYQFGNARGKIAGGADGFGEGVACGAELGQQRAGAGVGVEALGAQVDRAAQAGIAPV